jgi:hypothetical protein
VCLAGIFTRVFPKNKKGQIGLAEGCKQKVDYEFFNYVLKFRKMQRHEIYEKLKKFGKNREVIIFKSRRQARSYLKKLKYELKNKNI